MTSKFASLMLIVAALLLAACGTVATPIWEKPPATPTRVEPTRVGAVPVSPTPKPATPTPLLPTSTPVPATATLPVQASSPAPVAQATTPAQSAQPANDPIAFFVSQSNPAHGNELFHTFFDQAGYMCATCHRTDSEEKLIGPGLLNVGTRGATRVPGQIAERYIFNSITNPQMYVVPTFPENLMPQVYSRVFKEQDIYDLIAYLMTLKG
jgi:cytochrome c2